MIQNQNPKKACAFFQERLWHHFPGYIGRVSDIQMEQLYMLACTITVKKDGVEAWKSIEMNPFLKMYFRYQGDKIIQSDGKNSGFYSFVCNSIVFVLGAFWSWLIQEMDSIAMNWMSFGVLTLAPFWKKYGQKFFSKVKNFTKSRKNLTD